MKSNLHLITKSRCNYCIENLFLVLFILFTGLPTQSFSQTYTPGIRYIDPTGYVEYRAGNLPIIISAPHGGALQPSTIADRVCSDCSVVNDSWTKEIAEGIYDAFFRRTGCYPHVILNLLHRKKFDANRNIAEAAVGNPIVQRSWYAYQEYIDSSKARIVRDYGRGLFLDIHGHAHTVQRIEMGYLLSKNQLQLSNTALDAESYVKQSSIRALQEDNLEKLSHSELLRGENSFGTIMYKKGFPSVPSSSDPFPKGSELYFDGGYNTQRHGSVGTAIEIDAIQLELNQDIRFDATTRARLIDSLTTAAIEYINFHYNRQFATKFCDLISNTTHIDFPMYDVKIYPNPNQGLFNINSEFENSKLSIYNSLGHKVYSALWEGGEIDIEFLESGCYIIKLQKGNLILPTMRLIKY